MIRRCTFLFLLAGSPVAAETPDILTDIPPVQSLVSMVTGEVPGALLTGADDPHHVQLRPSQVRAMADADMLIWVGPGLTPWLGEELASVNADARLVTLGGDAGHGWLDPMQAADWVATIGAALGAETATAVEELEALSVEVQGLLEPVRDLRFLADHDAYDAFAERFGLTFVGHIADHDADEPGAAHLSELHELVEAGGVDCVLVGVNEPHDHADELAHDGVPIVAVDLVGAGLEPGPGLYPELIRGLSKNLNSCVKSD